MGFEERVADWVRRIPPGRVASYGQVALCCGAPRAARAVGMALHRGPAGVPCHRVVNRRGRTAPGWPEQRALLEAEGVRFTPEGRVDMARHAWFGEP